MALQYSELPRAPGSTRGPSAGDEASRSAHWNDKPMLSLPLRVSSGSAGSEVGWGGRGHRDVSFCIELPKSFLPESSGLKGTDWKSVKGEVKCLSQPFPRHSESHATRLSLSSSKDAVQVLSE